MMISFENTIKKHISKNIIQPRRSQIYVGFKCHQRCGFCYYKHRCDDEMFDLDFIRQQIDFKYEYGIRDFELTGGEPGEHPHLREICQYIKDKDETSKIAIITNGQICVSDIWDLIDEVLISYHLSRHYEHCDASIFPLGCTYSKVAKTIHLARKHGVLIRTNSVVGTFNIDDYGLVDDLIEFEPSIINFLPLNLFDDAINMSNFIDYDKFSQMMDDFIAKINNKLPQTLIFIRYVPFCVVENHIEHVVGHVQHIYDWFDWNRELDGIQYLHEIKQGNTKKLLHSLGKYGSTSLNAALSDRNSLYCKTGECLKCKYQLICDGIDRTQSHSTDLIKYIHPIQGQIVKNCLEYSKDVTYKYYCELYGKPA